MALMALTMISKMIPNMASIKASMIESIMERGRIDPRQCGDLSLSSL